MFVLNLLIFSGKDVLFAFVPEFINRIFFPQLVLFVYFTLMAIWSIQSVTLSMNALVNTVVDTFKFSKITKCVVTLAFCGSCLAFTLSIQNYAIFLYFQGWRGSGYWLLTMLVDSSTFMALGVYTVQRLLNDHIFVFGKQPNKYWNYGFKIAIYIFFVSSFIIELKAIYQTFLQVEFVIFLFYFQSHKFNVATKNRNEVLLYFLTILTICPIFIGIVVALVLTLFLVCALEMKKKG